MGRGDGDRDDIVRLGKEHGPKELSNSMDHKLCFMYYDS